MLDALRRRGIAAPYEHQARALQALEAGRNVVLATSTASGKSLCFQVPLVQAVLRDPHARALMVFPTKALARDQVESMRQLTGLLGPEGASGRADGMGPGLVGVATYDGDTPPAERRAARARAHAIATNPDMLHRGMLPHHDAWGRVLAGLRYLVLDELHTYRGLFGSHVGNVLRRLWRLCRHYGARPQVIACSATIAEPGALAEALCPWTTERSEGRGGVEVIDHDASPAGPRTFFVLNPRVVDDVTGVRRDYIKVTREITSILRRARVATLAFCRTRRAVELLTRYLRDDEASDRAGRGPGLASQAAAAADTAIRGYRGGYLPDRRREIEKALREGEARVVASTNALELGVDIGGMDAVVLAGYPGTRAASWQRVGRAGRRGQPSLAVLVLSSSPLDQFVAASPEFLLDRTVEQARVDPNNPEVLLPHVRCAAQELPIGEDEVLPGLSRDDTALALRYLEERGGLAYEPGLEGGLEGSGRYVVLGGDSVAEQVSLRGVLEENFSVLDPDGEVLAQVDFEDAPLYLHPGAIYPIEGRPYEVRALDWDGRKASVRPVRANYTTVAVSKLRVRVVDAGRGEDDAAGSEIEWGAGTGYAHVVRTVPGFKKIRLHTHENIGFGPVSLPDLERHTTAAFWGLPPRAAAVLSDPVQRAGAALAAAHALRHVAAMLLMCEVGDLMHAVTAGHPGAWGVALDALNGPDARARLEAGGVPHVVLLDRNPGGAGLAVHAFAMGAVLFDRVIAVVRGCGCEVGCPTCMGPSSEAAEQYGVERPAVIAVLEALREVAVEATAGGPR
ncbi:DEAD/DEAH box helicase [Paraliomyxa miuraensis]|uniref:DEAD/DEAH box helicase n=1 Tax=Paraliomyxa miuraensis TaxID=376150 RepID=UPI00225B10AE|nr:DEAD/DEAH box helicase [Paraliomyxa miuraensis]MCX4241066.1 DEAD/DEAH box helicase [Paraliomyxa miuraensis]